MPALSALPSLRQLRYLVVLSEKLSFRKAAEALFVTQSTLSAGIKELETTLDVQLVERDSRTVRLTAMGVEVTARARALLASAQDLLDLARRAEAPLSGVFRLGLIPTVAPFLLPGALPALRAAYPQLRLHLREDVTAHLVERLHAGELDAAVFALPWEAQGLELRTLLRDEFRFVARRDDPGAGTPSMAVREIDLDRLVLLEEGHCLRDHAIAACGRRAAGIAPVVEATSLHTLIQMVEGGLGVTLLPAIAVDAGILVGTQLVARPFTTHVPARTIVLASRAASARGRDCALLAAALAAAIPAGRGEPGPAALPAKVRRTAGRGASSPPPDAPRAARRRP